MHEERPVWVSLDGVRCCALSGSPHEPELLAVGHLLSEGWIADPADIRHITVVAGPGGSLGVQVDAAPARVEETAALHAHMFEHGCGLRHVLDCAGAGLPRVRGMSEQVDAAGLLRELFAAVDRGAPDGGVHGVATSDGARLLDIGFDVARHSAVDRAIGAAARNGRELRQLGLVSTARISGAMALKAVRVGLGWIAGRSIATSLAHEIAERHDLVLLERAGRSRST